MADITGQHPTSSAESEVVDGWGGTDVKSAAALWVKWWEGNGKALINAAPSWEK
jgi:hypothetical protein